MRKDFNKLLCERERRVSYSSIRNPDWDQFELNSDRGSLLTFVPENYDLKTHDDQNLTQFEDNDLKDWHPWEHLPKTDKKKGKKIHSKELNENLNPLVRFLRSNVGKQWDEIYSELCRSLRKDKAINLHVFQHLRHYVEKKTRIGPEGQIQYFSPYSGRLNQSTDNGWQDIATKLQYFTRDHFYVHPISKILCQWPVKSRKKINYNWQWFNHPRNRLQRFYFNNGIWYIVQFENIDLKTAFHTVKQRRPLGKPSTMYYNLYVNTQNITKEDEKNIVVDYLRVPRSFYDIFFKEMLETFKLHKDVWIGDYVPITKLEQYWGAPVRAISKRQLSKSEIKKFDLENLKNKCDKNYRKNPRVQS